MRMSTSMYEVFNWDAAEVPPTKPSCQGSRMSKSRDSSLERQRNNRPNTLKTTSADQSESRFSLWEFGDNFSALGQQTGASSPSHFPPPPVHSATAPATPTSSRRTASLLTGAGCTVVGELLYSLVLLA